MRIINTREISTKITELCLSASFHVSDNLIENLQESLAKETSPVGKYVLETIIQNDRIASKEGIAICQDTGIVTIFAEVGQEVQIVEGSFREAINDGVKKAYQIGYLRKSVVEEPVFERKNTNTNTPAFIYTDIIPGDSILFTVIPKGFGSENMSALAMLSPAHGKEGVLNFITKTVRKAGPNPCPPTIVGVGIGGTADMAMVVAKKATARDVGASNPDFRYAQLETEALQRINRLGIGPAGLGGNITSLAVHIDYLPTHIAGMPVAVNLCCHAARHAEGVL